MRKTSKPEKYFYLIMNKPAGYVCAAASDSHKTVYQLLTPELQAMVHDAPRGSRLHTVGRLDCDTSGLLLLTTDGEFSHRVAAAIPVVSIHPSGTQPPVFKTYLAELTVPVSEEQQTDYIMRAAAGLTLPPEKKYGEQQAAPAVLHFIKSDLCEIKITEGKFHEVRRIFRALGNEVKALKRTAIGQLTLPEDLSSGEFQTLSSEQLFMFL